jgi:arsenite methyltransferase
MKRFGMFFFAGAAVLALAGGPSIAQKSGSGSVSTSYDSSKDPATLLTGTERYAWQRPDQVIRFLAIREGEQVADIGAGMGYFSDVFSGMVGESGKVYAIETDPELVDYLEKRNASHPFPNTVVVRADETDLGLPTDTLDLAMTVNTWHRFADRGPLREALRKALKTGGRFVVLDWHLGEIPIAPPVEQRLPPAELIEEMVADGWTLTTNSRLLKYQYLLVFTPPAP